MTALADVIAQMTAHDTYPSTALVETVNIDGTVDLVLSGNVVSAVPVLSSYTPASGDVVLLYRQGDTMVVLGSLRTGAPATLTVHSSLTLKWNVQPPPEEVEGGGTPASGTFVYEASDSGAWRSATGWNASGGDLYQGAYTTSYGWYRSAWFYGDVFRSGPQSLRGRNVTSIKIEVQRETGSGAYASEPIYIYPHQNTARPDDKRYVQYAKSAGGVAAPKIVRLATGESDVFTLPNEWGDALGDGHIHGFGIYRDTRGDYLRLSGTSSNFRAGRLTIEWNE